MAVRSLRGLPITFPTTTGVAKPLTGGVLAQPRAAERRRASV
jgi:anhydro-N-acetylmuramic acid kinase